MVAITVPPVALELMNADAPEALRVGDLEVGVTAVVVAGEVESISIESVVAEGHSNTAAAG